MATKTSRAIRRSSSRPAAPDSYFRLVRAFPLVCIRNDAHLDAALEVIGKLMAGTGRDDGEREYLETLGLLIADYEEKHHAIAPASDAELLKHLLEAKGISQTKLSLETGVPKSSISEILSGKKPFSRRIIGALSEYFHVGKDVLSANL